MENLLVQVPAWIQTASLILTALTLLATVIARVTPAKRDDEYMTTVTRWVLKALKFLPTIGINPRTKKLEETIMELREATQPGVSVESAKNS